MTEPRPEFEYVGFWRRLAIAFADLALLLLVWPFFLALERVSFGYGFGAFWFYRVVVSTAMPFVLNWWLITRCGGTPGKLLFRVRIVDRRGRYLSWFPVVLRDLPNLMFIPLSLWIDAAVLRSASPAELASQGAALLAEKHGGILVTVNSVLAWGWLSLDILTVAFNQHKRALHDYLAGSYVVTKASLLVVQSQPALHGGERPPIAEAGLSRGPETP